jgi:predicted Zn finger-like uncharacterized protein
MILQCPQCSTRFLVADHLIPPDGRTVKCGACKHDWHVSPADSAADAAQPATVDSANFAAAVAEEMASPSPMSEVGEPEPVATAPAPKNLPVVSLKKLPVLPMQIAAAVLLLGWCISAIYGNFYNWQNMGGLKSVYAALGVIPTDGLRFDKVEMTREKQGQRTRFLLTGKVVNESPKPRTIPLVRVVLTDKDGKEIWSREYEVSKDVAAGDEYPFRISNVETSFGNQVHRVTMDLGNEMQLSFR